MSLEVGGSKYPLTKGDYNACKDSSKRSALTATNNHSTIKLGEEKGGKSK
jgi:hypothetical protein